MLMPVVRGASLILFAVVIVNFVCSLGIQGIDNSLSGLQSVKNRLEDRNTDLLVEQVVLNFKPSIERLAFQQLGLVNGIERGQVVRFNRKTGRFEPVPESGQVARLDRKKGPFEPI
ncbi:MAG: hypothetical protein CSA20_05770 [Deltaproteobacteria bacterium]|nr:MAG: hypothetical protein CSB23_03670 [Deltaproteobacteria bacterium]PIE72969.1 MAG: hypothetical protein CSA20_05770 [Deltaproteobacteria bacterium]